MAGITEESKAFDDGVVKYSLEFKETKPLAKKECKKIEKIRERLYALGMIGAYSNGIGYGNISLRYKNSNQFLITATQTGELAHLKPKYYSLVKDVNFNTFATSPSLINNTVSIICGIKTISFLFFAWCKLSTCTCKESTTTNNESTIIYFVSFLGYSIGGFVLGTSNNQFIPKYPMMEKPIQSPIKKPISFILLIIFLNQII